jgi:branched-chain amino acid transport system ATP-binding protein
MIAPMRSPALIVKNVERRFGGVRALAGVDFDVEAGEFAGLIGPNGSGKSTLVNVITRMVDADSGSITLSGVEILQLKPHLVADVGLTRTYQHIRLTKELTMRENVAAGLLFRHQRAFGAFTRLWADIGMTRRAALSTAESILDLMEVPTASRSRLPKEVPFTIQRRTEIARALVASPKVVLLDEPAAGMNPAEVIDLGAILSVANRELRVAIVLIEHNMDLVMRVAQRITVINRGVCIASGTALEVRNDPVVIEAYLGTRSAHGGRNLDRTHLQ